MLLSKRVFTLKPSPTIAMSDKANKMKAEGIDIINLSLGEPDLATPKEALLSAHMALDNGKTKYTAVDGTVSLKNAIQTKFKAENNLDFELNEIFVSSGAKQAIFNAFMASLNSGDEVIMPAPYWVSYSDVVELFEGKPIIVKTKPENHFKITPDELRNAITSKTKWLILNSPSNPTGEVYSFEELKAIAGVLREHPHVYVMSDDIYEHLIFDELKFCNILNVEPCLAERVFVVNGVSKSYSMTGFRIGYGAMKNKDFIKTVVNIQSQSTSNASSIAQEGALGALTKCSKFPAEMREIMQKRRDFMFDAISKIKGLTITKPSGAFYLFIGVKELYGKKTPQGKALQTDGDVAEYLLTQGKVATVFGLAFGYPDFIRISYATSDALLKEGAIRIAKAISELS
jgi:aspartate aminotransferase